MKFASLIALSLLSLGGTDLALAQDVGQHPAVFAPRQLPGIDPNTFIPGHPASPRNRAGHANHEHPAVARWAQGAATAPDSNHFLVQPPATTRWTLGPQAETPVATAPPAPAALARNDH